MKNFFILLSLLIILISNNVSASSNSNTIGFCIPLMSSLKHSFENPPHAGNAATGIYMSLIKHLVTEKGALASKSLVEMSSQASIPNPLNYLSRPLSTEDNYAFQKAFSHLKNIDWSQIKKELLKLADERKAGEADRLDENKKTANLLYPILRRQFPEYRDLDVINSFQSLNGELFFLAKGKNGFSSHLVNMTKNESIQLDLFVYGNVATHTTKNGNTYISFVNYRSVLKVFEVDSKGKVEVRLEEDLSGREEINNLRGHSDKIKTEIIEDKAGRIGILNSAETTSGRRVYSRLFLGDKESTLFVNSDRYPFGENSTGQKDFIHLSYGTTTRDGKVVIYNINEKREVSLTDVLSGDTLLTGKLPNGFPADSGLYLYQSFDGDFLLYRVNTYKDIKVFNISKNSHLVAPVSHSASRGSEIFQTLSSGAKYLIGYSTGGANRVSIFNSSMERDHTPLIYRGKVV